MLWRSINKPTRQRNEKVPLATACKYSSYVCNQKGRISLWSLEATPNRIPYCILGITFVNKIRTTVESQTESVDQLAYPTTKWPLQHREQGHGSSFTSTGKWIAQVMHKTRILERPNNNQLSLEKMVPCFQIERSHKEIELHISRSLILEKRGVLLSRKLAQMERHRILNQSEIPGASTECMFHLVTTGKFTWFIPSAC